VCFYANFLGILNISLRDKMPFSNKFAPVKCRLRFLIKKSPKSRRLLNVTSGCGPLSARPFLSLNQNRSASFGTVHGADLFYRQQIQALVSSRCGEESRELGRLGYSWKMPVLNRMGTNMELFRRELFPTVVQCTDTNVISMGIAILRMMSQLNQTDVRMWGRGGGDEGRRRGGFRWIYYDEEEEGRV
jgi:hypothetical protein